MTTTNYYDSFIAVADNCPVASAEVPPTKDGAQSVASMQYDMIAASPYEHTSDDVIFSVYAVRSEVPKGDWAKARVQYFAKGQPCLRSSPLGKRYGWGIHSDDVGRVALYAAESADYARLIHSLELKQLKAMRSKRA